MSLNHPLPFRSAIFDAVTIVEVIEHIENQPQLIREISRLLRPGGHFWVAIPNAPHTMSRIQFIFTGFMRGRIRPIHYSKKPVPAPNIHLLHFYELYYLLFHYGFTISELRSGRIKFASRALRLFLWPLVWVFSLFAIVYSEKDPVQRAYNRQIRCYMLHPAILLSNNIVVTATKTAIGESRVGS